MSTFVLVHGSWHGGWCWEEIAQRLSARGHTAISPDLRSLAGDPTPPGSVTLDMWTGQISEIIRAQQDPVVLVGHSRGGIVISAVAEALPDRISSLVYLCAFLVPNGKAMIELAKTDTESIILPNLTLNEAEGVHVVDPAFHRQIFYGECTEDQAIRASARPPISAKPAA